MDRKSRISTAVLALSITLNLIPITAQQNAPPPSDGTSKQGISAQQIPNQGTAATQRNGASTQPPTIGPAPTSRGTTTTDDEYRREELAIQSRIAEFNKLLVVFG